MKKILSIFLALIISFSAVAIGITQAPHAHAASVQSTENNFVYQIVSEEAVIVDYTDKQSTDEIIIPDTLGGHPVTKIAAEAFKGCLCTAVSIPASVTAINVEAFAYDMPNLERYTVDENNPQYLSDESGILYTSKSNTYPSLFSYPKNASAETLDLVVLRIRPFAFTEVSNLKSITLTSYGSSYYYTVDEYAFYNATSLESVTIKGYVNKIGDHAFACCPSLESVNINSIVYSLGWEIFKDTPFINDKKNFDNDGVLYMSKNLIATHEFGDIKEYYEIKKGTVSVAGGAFEWDQLKEIYICDSVEYITSNPFAKCPNLETFSLGSASNYVVENYYGVLREDYYNHKVIAYPNGKYQSCYMIDSQGAASYALYLSPIKNVYITSSVTSSGKIGYMALGGENVTDIHVTGGKSKWESIRYKNESYRKAVTAEEVAEIHYNDFYDDNYRYYGSTSTRSHLSLINNADYSVCTCGYTAKHGYADGECTENGLIYKVVNSEAVIIGYKFKDSTDAVVIPSSIGNYSVVRLESGAFKDCMFTSVEIPSSVREIDPEAFAYSPNNQQFIVSELNKYYKSVDGVLFDSEYAIVAYPQNAPATEYSQPYASAKILPYAFSGSKNLKTLNSWQDVTVMDNAFINSSVETVEGTSFKYLGNGVFRNSALKEFSMTSVPDYFGYNVFEGTPFLENAVYDEDGVFYHENILVETKKDATKNYYAVKDGTEIIAGGAFIWNTLEEVHIPESVKLLSGASFCDARNIKTFTINENNPYYTVLDFGIIYESNKTTLVACPPAIENTCYGIPGGVTEIGAFAFHKVRYLSRVYIPYSMKTINEYAFGVGGYGVSSIVYDGTEQKWNTLTFVDSGSDMQNFINFNSKSYKNYNYMTHDIVKIEDFEPTCTDSGYTKYTCACGNSRKQTTKAALGHKPAEEYTIISKPTCTKAGEERLYCTVCSATVSTKTPAALGHTPAEEYTLVSSPTCEKAGKENLYCTVCSATVSTRTPEALGHNKELIEYRKPTCETIGENVYKCTRCKKEFVEEANPALGHVSSGETVRVEPTCTEDGGLYYLCDRCNKPIQDECLEIYPATGHTPGEWKCTLEPTCTYKQLDTLYCAVCTKAIDSRIGDYGDHIYMNEVYEQTCTYKRIEFYCIGGCDDYYFEEISVPNDAILGENEFGLGHIVEEITKEATCTRPGKTYKKCTVCRRQVGNAIEETEALGHKWVEDIYCEPTCTEEGEVYRECEVCYEYEFDTIPTVAHTFDEWKYENGNSFSGVCTVCEEKFEVDNVEIAFERSEMTVYNQDSRVLAVTVTENLFDSFVFTSSDSSVVEVDSSGKITAKAPGTAVITAKIDGTEITAQCEITVKKRSFRVDWYADGEIIYYSYIEEGAKIEAPEAPEIANCRFMGWSPSVPEIMPATKLTFTAIYAVVIQSDDFDVSATYLPGCYNERITLEVEEIQGEREPGGVYMVDGEYYKQVGLYNIKTVNESSDVVQPNEGYKVTIRIAIPAAYRNYISFMIYHRFTGGGREQLSTENDTLRVEDGYLVFEVTKFSEFEIFVPTANVKITHLPDKVSYNYRDKIDLTGIKLKYTSAEGKTKTITDTSLLTVTGFDGTKTGEQTVTVHYGRYSDTFNVTVSYSWWQQIIRFLFFGFLWY